jgi:two-component system nitrogen regulation sensor histidine kinase NtrY
MSLRTRLLVAFLLIGTVPALALVLLSLSYVRHSIELLQNPGVEALLENSIAMARQSIAPREDAARAMARDLAASEALRAAVAANDRAEMTDLLQASLPAPAPGTDGQEGRTTGPFVCVLETPPGVPRDPGSAPPPGVEGGPVILAAAGLAPDLRHATIPSTGSAALDPELGVVWCREALVRDADAEGPPPQILVAWRLEPDLADRARALARGLPLYRSLGAYKRVRLHLVWAVTALLVLLLILVAWLWARAVGGSLSRPIERLVEGTRRVGTGDYEYRVEIERPDEIGRLVAAFNRMTSELKDQSERLRQAERVAAWREVARRLAHQIKNPLTPIQLSIHRLRGFGEGVSEEKRAVLTDCLDTVADEVENLRRIADEFSRFARLPQPQLRPVDLAPLVRSVVELYHAGHADIDLVLETGETLPAFELDPDLTRQALSNLVKNAVEAMPHGGELRVLLARGPRGGARVTIQDTGGGLPQEVRENLFTPYLTTKPGGTGLGLALAHRMVVDQGGDVEVLIEEGCGTTFHVDFPATASVAQDARGAVAGEGPRPGASRPGSRTRGGRG